MHNNGHCMFIKEKTINIQLYQCFPTTVLKVLLIILYTITDHIQLVGLSIQKYKQMEHISKGAFIITDLKK